MSKKKRYYGDNSLGGWWQAQTEAMYVQAVCISAALGMVVGLAMFTMTKDEFIGIGVGFFMFLIGLIVCSREPG